MVSQAQLKDWKDQHGQVLELSFSDGRQAFLKQPDKKILGLAYAKGAKDPLGVADVIVANCWLGGDDDVKDDVGCLISIQELANEIAGRVECEVVQADKHVQVRFADGKACNLRRPTRSEAGQAMIAARRDAFQMVDTILNACWLDGDQDIKTSGGHLISLIQIIDELIGVKAAQVKKI